MAHHHFTHTDRVLLQKLLIIGKSVPFCAEALGFHVSTVYRELKRGQATTVIGYSVRLAQDRADNLRTQANQQHRKLFSGSKLAKQVLHWLRQYYSPDQIGDKLHLSHSTIYRWLWSQGRHFIDRIWKYLRHPKLRRAYGTKRRAKQRELLKKRWIEERPLGANNRSRYGHWEGDTVVGRDRSGYIATFVDRKSGYLLAALMTKKEAKQFQVSAERCLVTIPAAYRQTLTLDNGTEMANFEEIERRTELKVYFAHPYHSWERGTNENTNGLLRQFFPKNRDFSTITQEELDWAVDLINTRPRKRHNYQSPERLVRKKFLVAI